MTYLEASIPPVEIELGETTITIVAGMRARAAEELPPGFSEEDLEIVEPFNLISPEPAFLPVALDTELGRVALYFQTRNRAVDEGPRRTSLSELVCVATGEGQEGLAPEGAEVLEAPAWAVPPTGEPASLRATLAFPLATNPPGLTLSYTRAAAGRAMPILMSTESQRQHQDAIESAFHAFVDSRPGIIDILERGLAAMDARILRFEADRLVSIAEREASKLRQGAEVIEEVMLPPEELGGPGPSL